MAGLAEALNSEIASVVRKHMREQAQASSVMRQELAALRRRVDELERQLAKDPRPARPRSRPRAPAATQDSLASPLRFSAKGFAKLRKRLGLSAAAIGALAGVTAQSVYKWEDGRARPRASQLQAIAAVRKLGKLEAAARLEQMQGQPEARRA